MINLRTVLTCSLITLSLTGCARFGVSNGSTDYLATKQLAPLAVPPSLTMRPQQSLYPAPIIDEQALAHAPKFRNAKGNRFEMPRAQPVASQAANTVQFAVSHPQSLNDGSGNPLLKIDGAPAEVWTYVQAAASVGGLTVDKSSTTPYQIAIMRDNQKYQLRLTPNGSSNTLGVYDSKNNYATPDIARDILNAIAQNWTN